MSAYSKHYDYRYEAAGLSGGAILSAVHKDLFDATR